MKTIRFKCDAACCMAFLGMGCTASFEEYNTNPNQMEMWEIGPESLLENLVFKEFECLLHRTWYINGELIQYTVSGSSLNAFHRYVISNGVPSDHWATQFQWAATADHMYRLALEQNDVNCQAIALTMRAFCMAHCTDGFGDVPFTEAFQGRDGLAQPLFDTQRSIYERLYEDLELANSLYDVSKSLKSPSRDLLYGGDMAKWKRFTNSLHLRLLMRCINRDGELGISERIRSLVSQPTLYPLFESNDDNATLFYTGVVPFVNYFKNTTYENFTTYGRRASASFVDRMAAIGDPRLSIYFVRRGDAWGGYPSGEPVDYDRERGQSQLGGAGAEYVAFFGDALRRSAFSACGSRAARRDCGRRGRGVLRSGDPRFDRLLARRRYVGRRVARKRDRGLSAKCRLRRDVALYHRTEIHRPVLVRYGGVERVSPHRISGADDRVGDEQRPYSAHAFRISGQHLHDQPGELCTGSRASGRVVARRRRQHAHARVVEFAGGATIPKTLKR